MVEVGYGYSKLDKIHYYSVVVVDKPEAYWSLWLWHRLRFRQTKIARLLPYHPIYSLPSDGISGKIVAKYYGRDAKTVSRFINLYINKHRKKLGI